MASNSTAYDFARFSNAPGRATREAAKLRVYKSANRKKNGQVATMLRRLALIGIIVALAFGLLYTETQLTELQGGIVRADTQLVEEQALNAYLNGELEQMVNLRNIEERAAELNLVQVDSGKVVYIRVQESDTVQVRQSTWQQTWESIREFFAGLFQ